MALRLFGYQVIRLGDVYPNDGQEVSDVQWIEDSARHGYIAFTANPSILYVPHEIDAVREHGARIFCIGTPNHTREGKGLIFGRHLLSVARRARKPGPCFWRLYPHRRVTYDIP